MRSHKKNIPIFFSLLLVTFYSCKKESAFKYPQKPVVTINAGDDRLKSSLIHFTKDTVYILATNISVDSGQQFVLDAGTLTRINQSFYITVQRGASIEAKGTMEAPVIFTSNAGISKGTLAPWGGIRIFGNRNTSGNSSGSLSYVRIEFAGGGRSSSSSLLLTNVSKQTTLNNIQISYSLQNSFEFNNGNCNGTNLLSYASTGTDFYINNGYTGFLQNLLSYRHPFFAATVANLAGIHIDGNGTLPAISNATVLGASLQYGIVSGYLVGTPQRRAALITSGGCKFHIRNSAFVGYPLRTYYLDNYNTAAALDSGKSDFTYSVIYHSDTSQAFFLPAGVYPPNTSVNLKNFLLRVNFKNELFFSLNQFNLIDPYNYHNGIPNPFPNAGSPLLTGANFNDISLTAVFTDPFFKQVNYRGALGDENWMQGWVNFIPLQTDYNY